MQEEYLAGLLRAEAGSKGYLARVLAAMQAKYKYLLELTSESQIYYRQSVPQNTGAAAALCIEGLVLEKNTRNHWGSCRKENAKGRPSRRDATAATPRPRAAAGHARGDACSRRELGRGQGLDRQFQWQELQQKKNGGLALKEGSLASKADLEAVEERGRRGWWQQAYAVEGSEPYRALVAFLGDVRCVRQALP